MERPVLKIKLSYIDWLLELLALAVVVIIILFAINAYKNVSIFDDQFHYRKHHYNQPQTIFIFPALAVIMYCGFTLMNTVPHTFKYLVIITPENAERQYHNGLVMLRAVKLTSMILLLLMTFANAKSI